MKHIDVAHLWLQDDVKSNRLRLRRVKSEDNFADIGTKALGIKIIRKHATSMGYTDAQESLKPGVAMGLWGEQIRVVQISRKRHWNQLVAMPDSSSNSSGSEGSQVSERQLEARRLAILWFVSTQADCHGQLQFFPRRFLDELVLRTAQSS